jgi:hypothetical protein
MVCFHSSNQLLLVQFVAAKKKRGEERCGRDTERGARGEGKGRERGEREGEEEESGYR